MSRTLRSILYAIAALVVAVSLAACGGMMAPPNVKAIKPLSSELVSKIASIGAKPGAAMMVRIFKESSELEVWKQTSAGPFKLVKTYEICSYSGGLGPKVKEGDRQSPEGFYTITPGLMNPKSNYYLAFNTGFPNKFDRVWGRTGSDLMVHGDCSSRGCYAMTDDGIAEIYALARETFKGGNASFQLQIFPFKLTAANLAKQAKNEHLAFWKDIKEGYDLFELTKTPPAWDVCERQYIFNASGGGALNPMAACPAVVQVAGMAEKLQAEEAAFTNAVESETQRATRVAAEEAALKERSAAISGFVGGLGNIFGGGKDADVVPVMTGKAAPVPMPALKR